MSSSDSVTPLPLDPELLGELREKVPAAVIEQLTHHWRKQTEALARSQKENRLLRELLRLMRVEKYGPASERLSDEQLELLEQEPGVSEAEIQAESERAQLPLPLKGTKPRPVRQSLPAELPRIEQFIACLICLRKRGQVLVNYCLDFADAREFQIRVETGGLVSCVVAWDYRRFRYNQRAWLGRGH